MVCVIKLRSNGGATVTCLYMIKVCSSGYNNNVKLYNIIIIVHYNVCQASITPVGLEHYVCRPCYANTTYISINYNSSLML